MEGPVGAVLLASPLLYPPRAGLPPLPRVLPLPHEAVGLGHVPNHSCGSASRHHELDDTGSTWVGEGVDGPGQMARPSLRAHPPPARQFGPEPEH
eukprot:1029407-Rhodomonas_salina.2